MWLRIALLIASVAALAAELVDLVVITEAQIARLTQQFGPIAGRHLTGWKGILTDPKYRTLPEREKLELVNDFMNRPRFLNDIDHWGHEDTARFQQNGFAAGVQLQRFGTVARQRTVRPRRSVPCALDLPIMGGPNLLLSKAFEIGAI